MGGCNKHTDPSQAPNQVRTTESKHDREETNVNNSERQPAPTSANVKKHERGWERRERMRASANESWKEQTSEDRPVGEMGRNEARDETAMVIAHHGKHTGHQRCAALRTTATALTSCHVTVTWHDDIVAIAATTVSTFSLCPTNQIGYSTPSTTSHYHLAKRMATPIDVCNAFARLHGMAEEHEPAVPILTENRVVAARLSQFSANLCSPWYNFDSSLPSSNVIATTFFHSI
jgi:hypothetical protein